MINQIKIKKYKSIDELTLPLGRINVLIGENGAGKSNILEAIALAGAAAANKLDNEFLTSRGIRVTQPEYMRSAFPGFSSDDSILIDIIKDDDIKTRISYKLSNDNKPYSKWKCERRLNGVTPLIEKLHSFIAKNTPKDAEANILINSSLSSLIEALNEAAGTIEEDNNSKDSSMPQPKKVAIRSESDNPFVKYLRENAPEPENDVNNTLKQFIVYSPENSSLRTPYKEGQIEPLGVNGEGLLRLASVLSADPKYADVFSEIRRSLQVLGWFDDLKIVDDGTKSPGRIEIKDRYLEGDRRYFDQLSTNEGFLFLFFYFSLFTCDLTPAFFAIDNIDASLNPKLCRLLMQQLVLLAKIYDRQVIFTTHNPAILDGLNLDDDDQRLFVVSRNIQGYTRLKRIKKSSNDSVPVRLSEAFLRGSLGGLPKEF